jgi:hypothetical protein
MGGGKRLGMPSLEAIPINQICKSDGFREELSPPYAQGGARMRARLKPRPLPPSAAKP